MYENYIQLCSYCGHDPITPDQWGTTSTETRIQLVSLLTSLLKQLELKSKPKGNAPPIRKAVLKEADLTLPYTETALLKGGLKRDFLLRSVPAQIMIDIKDSIQNEFFARQADVKFREERLGLDLIVTQKAQMSLFDPRTTVKKSNLYNPKTS